MSKKMDPYMILPKEAPRLTEGEFFLDNKHIITGNENGIVMSWNLEKKGLKIIHKMSSKINTISSSESKNILIGANSGEVVVSNFDNLSEFEQIQTGKFNVSSRIWKSLWLTDNKVIITGTYGKIKLFIKEEGNWIGSFLSGTGHSIFGLGKSEIDNILSTGDYWGKIIIWLFSNGEYEHIQKLKILQTIQGIAWIKDEIFAVINKPGRIYLFEKTGDKEWNLVFEISGSSGQGKSINITQNGRYVFAATYNEIIQFDRETHQFKTINIRKNIKITTYKDKLYAITSDGIYIENIEPVEVREDIVKYKYLKIGIVGHTGVGKTALCSYITTGSPGDADSTYGRNVWEWIPAKEDDVERKIVFHDHGGQRSPLSTFLPFLSDSDIILILFQQNDDTTLETAMNLYDLIRDDVGENVRIYFIQTHIDHRMADLDDRRLTELIDAGYIRDTIKVCPLDGSGIEEFKALLLEEDMWNKTRTMIQTTYTDIVLDIIMELQSIKLSIISFDEFKELYEKKTSLRIPDYHLKFLLRNYSDQGIIDYYPDILPVIIVYDTEYNDLKSAIPIYVKRNDGIINYDSLLEEFNFNPYVNIIDNIYTSYEIAIKNNGMRIFPKLLKDDSISIDTLYIDYLKMGIEASLIFHDQKVDIIRILKVLSELRGQCIQASKSDALFSWMENIVLYFNINRIGNAMDGFKVCINYRIGGKNEEMYRRREIDFKEILETLFGSYEIDEESIAKKKGKKDREIIYEVALSCAGEQREFVRTVANLFRSEGIRVFYDEFFEGIMWGRDLSEYLWKVYYENSEYCMMFISNEYVQKAWPTFERKAAIARDIEELGGYILPVRFDDVEVPGLLPSIKYISVNKNWPEEGTGKNPKEIFELYIREITP